MIPYQMSTTEKSMETKVVAKVSDYRVYFQWDGNILEVDSDKMVPHIVNTHKTHSNKHLKMENMT